MLPFIGKQQRGRMLQRFGLHFGPHTINYILILKALILLVEVAGSDTYKGIDFSDSTLNYVSPMFPPVVLLKDENFRKIITEAYDDEKDDDLSGPVMVTLFDPNCPHCQRWMPHYAIAARYFYEHNHDRKVHKGVAMFAVDCRDQEKICDRFDVNSYPNIVYGLQKDFLKIAFEADRLEGLKNLNILDDEKTFIFF